MHNTDAARRPSRQSLIGRLPAGTRRALVAVGLLSALVNVLYLTGSFFMLQVYDRVIPSRSMPTLVALALLAGLLYLFQCALDIIRSRILVRVGMVFDESMSARVFDAVVQAPLAGARAGSDGLQPLRDVASVRGFLASGGPIVFFDLPWLPFFLALCFLFHPLIGLVALGGSILLVLVALTGEALTRKPASRNAGLSARRFALAEAGRRNAEALAAMGMTPSFRARWLEVNDAELSAQTRSADIAGGFGAVSKAMRFLLQSLVLAIGAYLVVGGAATAGIMIASSILTSRALAPVELAVGQWKSLIAARQSWARLNLLLATLPPEGERMALPPPVAGLHVEDVSIQPPGTAKVVATGVRLSLEAGSALGIIGPSASGKSSLARVLAGVWTPARGIVRLDGAPLDHWSREALGQHVGYLPQDVELFAGTVAANIARLATTIDSAAVIAAARLAGIHEMILRLDDGYETEVGEQGTALSKGQRQRVALARALYGDPFLVILDEPNANLDQEGETALTAAILAVRARGGITVVVAHRPSAIAAVDKVMMLSEGRVQAFGPKDEVLGRVLAKAPVAPAPVPTHPLTILREAFA